ncbi:hypothetical protein MKW92_046587 [Papaver armeniacum]|nr:hypothetical protein MKW92_046587 [Papaver armeniacum]
MAHAVGFEAEVKCTADMFYEFFENNITQLVNCFPETYKRIEVIHQGDKPSVGKCFRFKSLKYGHFITTNEEMIAVNGENKSITCNFLEGDDSCLAKWSVNFEKAKGDLPFPTAFMDLLHKISVELPSKLLKQG